MNHFKALAPVLGPLRDRLVTSGAATGGARVELVISGMFDG
jgi:hypothetical protein